MGPSSLSGIGIDLGGTKIELRVLGPDGTTDFTARRATPRGDYDATIAIIRELVDEADTHLSTTGRPVGIGIPGSIDRATGTVKNANSIWLTGRKLATDLETALARPVAVANDANCFTLSEAVDGAGRGAGTVFGVILGTGVGGGLAIDGKILEGANRNAGEWGHNPMPGAANAADPGSFSDPLGRRSCYCGATGCIETFLSGPWLVREYTALGGRAEQLEEIAIAARRGEPLAAALIERFHERLAAGLATIVNILDPDIVVFGGGVSNLDRIPEEMTARMPHAFFAAGTRNNDHRTVATIFADARWGATSGARGAAWLTE